MTKNVLSRDIALSIISETILKSVTELFCLPVLLFLKSVTEHKHSPDHANFLVRIRQKEQKAAVSYLL